MLRAASTKLYLSCRARLRQPIRAERRGRAEDGFEVAQSMGIALLGLVVAAAFAELLTDFGSEIVDMIRDEISGVDGP
jgi:ornithine cyclodeaminase/alanine dehydrogenase-like protein (mu-crystallin family)